MGKMGKERNECPNGKAQAPAHHVGIGPKEDRRGPKGEVGEVQGWAEEGCLMIYYVFQRRIEV
jgi:hypothetical protein